MAATNNKLSYGTPAQLACSFASLANGSARESASQANTTNLYFDYLVSVTFTLTSGSPSTTSPAVNVYAAGSNDGTLWPIIQLSSGAVKATSGTDNSIGALSSPNQLRLIGQFALQTTTSSAERTFRTEPFSVAAGFAGNIPEGFSVLVENQTGISFSASTATTANYVEVCGIFSSSGN